MVPSRPVLYPYQRRWLADTSRLKAGMFARQTGKTFTATLEIVRDCIDAEDAERSGRRKIGAARWVILSRGERQAREAMEEGVKRHLQTLQRAHEYAESNDLGASEVKVLEVRLPGGSCVTALPANPDTARGFSANVLLDEFAFHADSRKIWAALFPVISAGKKLRVVSTPNGKANKFYELMTDPEELAEGKKPLVAARGGHPSGGRRWASARRGLAAARPRRPRRLGAGVRARVARHGQRLAPVRPVGRRRGRARRRPARVHGRDRPSSATTSRPAATCGSAGCGSGWATCCGRARCAPCGGPRSHAQAAALDELVERYDVHGADRDGPDGHGARRPPRPPRGATASDRVEGVLFTADTKQHLATLLKQHAEDRKMPDTGGHRGLSAPICTRCGG